MTLLQRLYNRLAFFRPFINADRSTAAAEAVVDEQTNRQPGATRATDTNSQQVETVHVRQHGNKAAESLRVWVACLIAYASLMGGVIGWRASAAGGMASDADFAGLHASLSSTETRSINFVNSYENYRMYTNYTRYLQMGDLLAEDISAHLDKLSEERLNHLHGLRVEAHDLAVSNQFMFPNRYLNPDGTYNLNRQLGELWADAAREKDVNPEPHYSEAELYRAKMQKLLLALLVLSIAPVFFSLIESIEGRWRYLLLRVGVMFLAAGTILAVLFELSLL